MSQELKYWHYFTTAMQGLYFLILLYFRAHDTLLYTEDFRLSSLTFIFHSAGSSLANHVYNTPNN